MIAIALLGLRERRSAMLGAFLALALGASLSIAAIDLVLAADHVARPGPQRFRAAPVLVAGTPAVTTTIGSGAEPETESDPNPRARPLPSGLAARVAVMPGVQRTVVDREIPLRLAVAGRAVAATGRPWSARRLAPFRLARGTGPEGAGEVVATAGGPGAHLGAEVRIVTPAGPGRFRVVGIVASRERDGGEAEAPLFFDDREASALLPRGEIVAVWPRAAAPSVASLVAAEAPGYEVLTGARRAEVEPRFVEETIAAGAFLLGLMLMVVGFVAVFVVASTFALLASLRRQEFALLRAVGATPRQVRMMVMFEALALALLGGACGALLSPAVEWLLARWLAAHGLIPDGVGIGFSLGALALGPAMMVPVALAGAWLTARRAAKVRPAAALLDAAADRRVMTVTRWLVGLPCLALAGYGVTKIAAGEAEGALVSTFAQAVLLIIGLSMLAPVVVPRLAAVALLPVRGAAAMLARRHARAAVRRTAALATPVLLVVGIAASMGVLVDTLGASESLAAAGAVPPGATVVAAPDGAPLSGADVDALESLPGFEAGAVLDTELRALGPEGLVPIPAHGIDPDARSMLVRWKVLDGSLDDLRGATVALGEMVARGADKNVGQSIVVWRPDGSRLRLRVVAILADGFAASMYVPREMLAGHDGPGAATSVVLRRSGPGEGAIARLRRILRERDLLASGGVSTQVEDPTSSSNLNPLALDVIVGVSLIYVAISLAGSATAATLSRRRELAALRLAGATRRQVTGLVALEALLATGTGAVLGLAIEAVGALSVAHTLGSVQGPAVLAFPTGLLILVIAVCVGAAVGSAVLTAARSQRHPPQALLS